MSDPAATTPDPARRFGATYSPCGAYRYHLWRQWGASGRTILWIMLNPSRADHLGNNDPTIARCEKRSATWGYSRIEVVNLFALRAPQPIALRRAADPVGPENDAHILRSAATADLILCAWGMHGGLSGRAGSVLAMLDGHALTALALTKSGAPAHPLYLSGRLIPAAFAPNRNGQPAA